MKVLVCGASRYQDREALFSCLDDLHAATPVSLIVNGGARGVDYLASLWANERGIELKVFKADRHSSGQDAFVVLNGRMLETIRPDLVVAFPGGTITADLIARAKIAGIPVKKVR